MCIGIFVLCITKGNTISLIPGQVNYLRISGVALRFGASGGHKRTDTFFEYFKFKVPQRFRNRMVLYYG